MELTTYGAILQCAIELEQAHENFYQSIGQRASQFVGFAERAARRRTMLERGRQEWVTEMILEPISSLHRSDYEIDWQLSEKTNPLASAVLVETIAIRFYTETGACIPIREAERAFRKLAKEHINEKEILQSYE